MILAVLIVMRAELKRIFLHEIRDEIRKVCEWILSDEFDAMKAQVASARLLNSEDRKDHLP